MTLNDLKDNGNSLKINIEQLTELQKICEDMPKSAVIPSGIKSSIIIWKVSKTGSQ